MTAALRRPAPPPCSAALVVAAPTLRGAAGARRRPAPAQIELVGQTTWVHPGERFDVRVQVAGAPADASVRLVVHEAPDSRQGFRATLDGDLGAVRRRVPASRCPGLPAGPGAPCSAGFVAGRGGVRLPRTAASTRSRSSWWAPAATPSTSFVTYLTFLTETPDFPPLAVAAVVDVGGPTALQPDGTVALRPGGRRSGPRAGRPAGRVRGCR